MMPAGLHLPMAMKTGTCISFAFPWKMPRCQAVDLCEVLADITLARGIGVQQEPRFRDDANLCCFCWGLTHKDHLAGLAINLLVPVSTEGVQELTLMISPGYAMPKTDVINVSTEDCDRAILSMHELLSEAMEFVEKGLPTKYVIWILRGMFAVRESVEERGLRVFPTHACAGRFSTAFALPTVGISSTRTRYRSGKVALLIKAILQVLSNNECHIEHLKPESEDSAVFDLMPDANVIASLLQMANKGANNSDPDKDVVLPKSSLSLNSGEKVHLQVDKSLSFTEVIGMVLRISAGGEDELPKDLHDALLAFDDGIRAWRVSTTVAGISFLAACASIAGNPKDCAGQLSCTKCGVLSHKHRLEGEIANILAFLERKVFSECMWPKEVVKRQLSTFFHDQRSAYVHSARVAMQKCCGENEIAEIVPHKKEIIHPEMAQKECVETIRSLAHLMILSRLANVEAAFAKFFTLSQKLFRPCELQVVATMRLKRGPQYFPVSIIRPHGFMQG